MFSLQGTSIVEMYAINDLHWQSQLEQCYYHSDILTCIITNVKLKCIENIIQTEPIFIMDQNITSWHADKKHCNLETGIYSYVDEIVIGCNSNLECLLVSCLTVF